MPLPVIDDWNSTNGDQELKPESSNHIESISASNDLSRVVTASDLGPKAVSLLTAYWWQSSRFR